MSATATTPEARTFWVAEPALGEVRKQADAWAKKARKLGLPPVTVELTGAEEARSHRVPPGMRVVRHDGVHTDANRRVHFRMVEVRVAGTEPVLDGWKLAAVVDHTVTDEANLVSCVPGMAARVDTLRFRKAAATGCDACGHARRRNKTYVLAHEDGQLHRVGSTCLQDYLPGMSPGAWATFMDGMLGFMRYLDEGGLGGDEHWGGGSAAPVVYDTADYLAEVVLEIELNGWLSRGAAWRQFHDRGASTADGAAGRMWDRTSRHEPSRKHAAGHPVTDEHRAVATEALAWARALPVDAGDDYLDNLAVACRSDTLPSGHMGLVASAITAYRRARDEEQRERLRAKAREGSEHQASVGDRIERDVRVTFTRIFAGTYGDRQLTKMMDNDGNVYVWWATSVFYEEGRELRLRGTVKEHDTYEGVAQTVLTRCTEVTP